VEPPVEDVMPRHRGRPRPESSPPAAAGPRAAAPGPRAASRGEAPAPRTEAPASRATAPTSRAAAPTSRAAAPISRAAAPISRAAAGDPRPTAPSSRPAPGPRVRGEAPVVRPAIEDDLDEEREEPIAPRRRSRAARPRATEPLEPPTAGRESAGGRRRPAAERPEPARPGRPRDLDDDGYTVDNSWSPEDGPDPDAPRRRPVPAWRKVIDHIVDLNLGNRRGGDGHRRRGGSSPRGGASAGGGGRRADSPTDRPRPQRSNPPTYLDNPNPTEDFADYDEPGWETPAAEPQVPRGGGQRGRRGTGSDDYPPEDRPPGRGRRRY
jgi:translation initiation factor IF-2